MLKSIITLARVWVRSAERFALPWSVAEWGKSTMSVMNANSATRMLGISGLVLAVTPQVAAAQGQATAVTEIRFDLSAVYEDNVARSSDALAAQRGLANADVIIAPTVTLNIARPFGRAAFAVSGSIGYQIHDKNSQLDRERINLNASIDMPVGPCRVNPSVGFSRGQSDLSDIVILPTPGIDNIKNVETVQRYGVDIGCGRDSGLQPFVAVAYEDAANSNALRERADFDAITYRAGLRFTSDAVGQISLSGSRRDTNLSPTALSGPDSTQSFDRVGAELKRDIGTRITTLASVGYGRLRSNNALINEFSGLVWNLDVTALIGANMRLMLGTGRDVGNSLSSDASSVVSKPNRIRLEYAFSDRMRFDGGVSLTGRRFGYSVVQPANAILRENRTLYDARLSYDIGRRFELRIYGGHERRNANGTFFDYNASFVGASFGVRF